MAERAVAVHGTMWPSGPELGAGHAGAESRRSRELLYGSVASCLWWVGASCHVHGFAIDTEVYRFVLEV